MTTRVLFSALVIFTVGSFPAIRAAESIEIRNLVLDSQSRLTLTETWQKKIFNEEVVPQASRFIKDLKADTVATASSVDLESIRRYLAFFGPKVLHRDDKDMKLLTYVRSERDCSACTVALIEVKRAVAARASARGFVLIWPTAEDLGDPTLAGEALELALITRAKETNAAGVLLVQLKKAPIDTIDAAGSDLKRLQAAVFVLARGEQEYRFTGKLDVIGEAALGDAVPTLLTEAFLDFGSKLQSYVASGASEDAPSEILLTVQGVQDFANYQALKNRIEELLLTPAKVKSIDKRKISRGQVTFAIRTDKNSEEIRRSLASTTSVPGQAPPLALSVTSSDAASIQAELAAPITAPASKGAP